MMGGECSKRDVWQFCSLFCNCISLSCTHSRSLVPRYPPFLCVGFLSIFLSFCLLIFILTLVGCQYSVQSRSAESRRPGMDKLISWSLKMCVRMQRMCFAVDELILVSEVGCVFILDDAMAKGISQKPRVYSIPFRCLLIHPSILQHFFPTLAFSSMVFPGSSVTPGMTE